MSTSRNSLQQFRLAADLCRKNELVMPAVAMIYSSIDTMAWLSCPATQMDVKKDDFISWADRYLLPDSGLTCTALELYSARCGVLHTMTPESNIVRTAGARKVLYGWGNHDARLLDGFGEHVGEPCVGVDVDALIRAFDAAVERFVDDTERDEDLKNRVEPRRRMVFAEWRLDDPKALYQQITQHE